MSNTLNIIIAGIIGFFLFIGIATGASSSGFDMPGNDKVTVNKIQKIDNGVKKLMKAERFDYKSGSKKAKSNFKSMGITFGS